MRLRWLRNLTIELQSSFFIGLVKSSIFWGMVAALVCRYGFDVEFRAMRGAISSPEGLLDWFYAFNYLALLASPLLVLGRAATAWVEKHFLKWWTRGSVLLSVIYGLQGAITNPFRGWRALYVSGIVRGRGHAESGIRGVYNMFIAILHGAWTLAMWIFFMGGFALVLTR